MPITKTKIILLFMLLAVLPMIIAFAGSFPLFKTGSEINIVDLPFIIIGIMIFILELLSPIYFIVLCYRFAVKRRITLAICLPVCIIANMGNIFLQNLNLWSIVIFDDPYSGKYSSDVMINAMVLEIYFTVSMIALIIGLVVVTAIKFYANKDSNQ